MRSIIRQWLRKIMTYLEVLSDFTNKPLEGKLPDEELSGFLVTPDFTESDGTRTESVRLLDSSSGGLKMEKLNVMLTTTTTTMTSKHT